MGEATLSLWAAADCDPSSSLPHSALAALHRAAGHAGFAEWHYVRAVDLANERQCAMVSRNYRTFRLQCESY